MDETDKREQQQPKPNPIILDDSEDEKEMNFSFLSPNNYQAHSSPKKDTKDSLLRLQDNILTSKNKEIKSDPIPNKRNGKEKVLEDSNAIPLSFVESSNPNME